MTSAEAGPLKRLIGLEYNYTECVVLDSSIQGELKRDWKLANAFASERGDSIVEWLPNNQDFKNRNELLTFKFTAHSCSMVKTKSALEFSTYLYNQLLSKYPGLYWNTISQTENDMICEWIIANSYQTHEIVRIIWTEKGIHFTSYVKRGSLLDSQTRAIWLDRLSKAKLRLD